MKTPHFWYQPDSWQARWLSPLEFIYRTAGNLRRALARPYHAKVPVICVGNVVAGGSGKTPTALALAAMLQKQGFKPAFVTRGYGGSQHGPLRVDPDHHTTTEVGDEALLLCRQAPVWIGRDRAKAIRAAENYASHIILDDGLQNPNVKPDVSLLVIDGAVGLGNGHIIPAGPLREPLAEALKRISAVVIVGETLVPLPFLWEGLGEGLSNPAIIKPPLNPPRKNGGEAHIDFTKPILRAYLKPCLPSGFPRKAKFLAFAGIGRPEKFYTLCRKEGLEISATQDFSDHHPHSQKDLNRLEQKARSLGATLLTTEKDFVRLPNSFRGQVSTFPVSLEFADIAAVQDMMGKLMRR